MGLRGWLRSEFPLENFELDLTLKCCRFKDGAKLE